MPWCHCPMENMQLVDGSLCFMFDLRRMRDGLPQKSPNSWDPICFVQKLPRSNLLESRSSWRLSGKFHAFKAQVASWTKFQLRRCEETSKIPIESCCRKWFVLFHVRSKSYRGLMTNSALIQFVSYIIKNVCFNTSTFDHLYVISYNQLNSQLHPLT